MQSRREFLAQAAFAAAAAPLAGSGGCASVHSHQTARRPNVVLILTDDQGYGDFHCHGNDSIRTPNLDRLHDESVRFTQCYVSPVCSPTRSSLMTGRYNYRTGIVDTFQGRSMMYPDEVTIAEVLSRHGYRTGIFGKWHLGDNYPMRPIDQGFEEALVHKGGGLCQPSEPANNSYFDPILQHNGAPEKRTGYCTDIFGNAAIEFIRQRCNRAPALQHAGDPFFVYLAFNAPHSPLIVDEAYSSPYRTMGLDENTAKTYGMITNLDENVGRLLDALQELRLAENTLVVFLTDNGAAIGDGERRYDAGLRGAKGTVYDGGIHVPCFMRWPGVLRPGKETDRVVAHIDLFPTLLEACGVQDPGGVRLDGRSLMPLLVSENTPWPDRTLYFQWHRGDAPELYRNCAARSQQYKLVNGKELYDMAADPSEKIDVAEAHPDVVAEMRKGCEEWFRDVSSTRGYDPPRIHIGTPHENPSVLTRQDWRGAESWRDGNVGYWEVKVARPGTYDILFTFPQTKARGVAQFRFNDVAVQQPIEQGIATCRFHAVPIRAANGPLHAYVEVEGKPAGVTLVTMERL
jgi:arylsulfatase A-like enzyme